MFQISRLPRLYFGIGAIQKLLDISKSYGKDILLITGNKSYENNPKVLYIIKKLKAEGHQIIRSVISNEPSPDDIDKIVNTGRELNPKFVLSVGGGSVIDAGKAVSAMLTVHDSVEDYLEGVGTKLHPGTKIPFVAIPTTSGTGSEATKNAVISKVGDQGYKKSLRHDNFVPDIAIVDSELTVNCPSSVTAASGMDAFTQLVESYLSTKSNPFTDALALDGIKKVIKSLEKAVYDGTNLDARSDMAYAAYLSGITLANAGLGVIHGYAQPLGSIFPIPHGVVCSSLMKAANEVTLKKLSKDKHEKTWHKYQILAGIVSENKDSSKNHPDKFIEFLNKLSKKISIPNLSEYGVENKHFNRIIKSTQLKNHPVDLSDYDLEKILQMSL